MKLIPQVTYTNAKTHFKSNNTLSNIEIHADKTFQNSTIRYTLSNPILFCVDDIIAAIYKGAHIDDIYKHIGIIIPCIFNNFTAIRLDNKNLWGCTVQHLITLVNQLPGHMASVFRSTTIYPILEHLNQDYLSLPSISDKNYSADLNLMDVKNRLYGLDPESITMSPSLKSTKVSDVYGACTYLILFNHNDVLAIKFGHTKNIMNRLIKHRQSFKNARIWGIFPCNYVDIALTTEQRFKQKMKPFLLPIHIDNNKYVEILTNVHPSHAEDVMIDVYTSVITDFTEELKNINPYVSNMQKQLVNTSTLNATLRKEIDQLKETIQKQQKKIDKYEKQNKLIQSYL